MVDEWGQWHLCRSVPVMKPSLKSIMDHLYYVRLWLSDQHTSANFTPNRQLRDHRVPTLLFLEMANQYHKHHYKLHRAYTETDRAGIRSTRNHQQYWGDHSLLTSQVHHEATKCRKSIAWKKVQLRKILAACTGDYYHCNQLSLDHWNYWRKRKMWMHGLRILFTQNMQPLVSFSSLSRPSWAAAVVLRPASLSLHVLPDVSWCQVIQNGIACRWSIQPAFIRHELALVSHQSTTTGHHLGILHHYLTSHVSWVSIN